MTEYRDVRSNSERGVTSAEYLVLAGGPSSS